MKKIELDIFTSEMVKILSAERKNLIDYKPICKQIRNLLDGLELVSKVDGGYIFSGDPLNSVYYEMWESDYTVVEHYLKYIIESVKLKCLEPNTNQLENFVESFIKIIDYIFPIPMQTHYRQFTSKNYQLCDYPNEIFASKEHCSIAKFINIKTNLIVDLIRLCWYYKQYNYSIKLYEKYSGIYAFDFDTLYQIIFNPKTMENIYRSNFEYDEFKDYNKYIDDLKKYQGIDIGDDFSIINSEIYAEKYNECYNLYLQSYFNVISKNMSIQNLLFLHNLFTDEKFNEISFYKYINSIYVSLKNSFKSEQKCFYNDLLFKDEALKQKIIEEKINLIESHLKELEEIIDQRNYSLFNKKGYPICKDIRNCFSDELHLNLKFLNTNYWLSILETEFKIQPNIEVLKPIETIISERIKKIGISLCFDEKVKKAERFFNSADVGNSNNINNAKNYKKAKAAADAISNQDCIKHICASEEEGNDSLLNIIAGSQAFFEEYKDLIYCYDYSFLFITIVKAYERYLKEIVIQNSPDYIPVVKNRDISSATIYEVNSDAPIQLQSNLLSSYETVFISNNSTDPKSCNLELGGICWTLKAIFKNNPNRNFFDKYELFTSSNLRDKSFPVMDEFVNKIRNGHFHIHCVRSYDDARDFYFKIALWFKATIKTFENFSLKKYKMWPTN